MPSTSARKDELELRHDMTKEMDGFSWDDSVSLIACPAAAGAETARRSAGAVPSPRALRGHPRAGGTGLPPDDDSQAIATLINRSSTLHIVIR